MNGEVNRNLLRTIVYMVGFVCIATTFCHFTSANTAHRGSSSKISRLSTTRSTNPPVIVQWLKQHQQNPPSIKAKRWLDLFGGSSVETRFPLPSRRQFPEVDWRGFNEDIFHESFGDFNPVKKWDKHNGDRN
ncbi:hypothetical protein CHUAL_007908 [Chamberlinius hualienensis]